MSERVRSRLRAAEKKVSAAADERWGYSLEQLIRAARGEEIGPPAILLKVGEPSVEELIVSSASRPKSEQA